MTDSEQDGSPAPGTKHQLQPGTGNDGLLAAAGNLSRYHREHEKYYSEAPLTDAISLQRAARTLIALAERWTSAEPAAAPAPSPFAGAPDLNDDRAIETSGVLFMEGQGEPAEITRIKSELQAIAASSEQNGSWLASAMEASWDVAEALLSYPELADLLAERHRIIGNNWQNASTAQLIARYLRRAVLIMQLIDFSPSALRTDLAGARSAPRYLYSAAELINHAADLSAASSVLTHEDERRWRIFHQRVEQISHSDLMVAGDQEPLTGAPIIQLCQMQALSASSRCTMRAHSPAGTQPDQMFSNRVRKDAGWRNRRLRAGLGVTRVNGARRIRVRHVGVSRCPARSGSPWPTGRRRSGPGRRCAGRCCRCAPLPCSR
jgi:hypothetical protein